MVTDRSPMELGKKYRDSLNGNVYRVQWTSADWALCVPANGIPLVASRHSGETMTGRLLVKDDD